MLASLGPKHAQAALRSVEEHAATRDAAAHDGQIERLGEAGEGLLSPVGMEHGQSSSRSVGSRRTWALSTPPGSSSRAAAASTRTPASPASPGYHGACQEPTP